MNYIDPWSIQIEFSKGCTRLCKWCGLSSIRTKPKQDLCFMSLDLATDIAKQLGAWFDRKRVEFALRGEPTLNPNCTEIVSIFRKYFSKAQLMLTTNGDIIRKNFDMINNLFNAGLNILLVDVYDNTFEQWKEKLSILEYDFYDFFKDKSKVYTYKGYKNKEIIIMDNISTTSGRCSIRVLNNQGGSVNCPELGITPLRYPLLRRCSNPFRELVVFNDGSVPICCMGGYKNEFIVGKTPEQSLKEIWNSDLYNAVRVFLFHKQRVFEPCSSCDYKGYKLGLLKQPDNMSIKDANEILETKTRLRKISLDKF